MVEQSVYESTLVGMQFRQEMAHPLNKRGAFPLYHIDEQPVVVLMMWAWPLWVWSP